MKGSLEHPKVFISYSWTTPVLEDWVVGLAERLTQDGIIVVLDKWDLKEGQDKHVFMEKMVLEKEIKRVLVICDKGYQKKADERRGGVGTESQLISKEVYEKTDQEKFIPIIIEYDEKGLPCVPKFFGARIYIDLSKDEIFEENYIRLLGNLYGKPKLKKPALGVPPSFITDDEQIELKTSRKVLEIKESILNDKDSGNAKIYNYLDTFILSLHDFRIHEPITEDFDEKILESIEKMTPLRDDFVNFTYIVFNLKDVVNIDKFHDFFEKLIALHFSQDNSGSHMQFEYDNFKFFTYELFLYFFTILFQLKRFKDAADLINAPYFYRSGLNSELNYSDIKIFNRFLRSLDEIRNKRLNLRRVSITADLIKNRATREDVKLADLMETDLIFHYITSLKCESNFWFPRTTVFGSRGWNIELFEKMYSKRHFENIKSLFEVASIEEFRNKVNGYLQYEITNPRNIDSFNYNIPHLSSIVNLDDIGKIA